MNDYLVPILLFYGIINLYIGVGGVVNSDEPLNLKIFHIIFPGYLLFYFITKLLNIPIKREKK